jgi:hypothetical protein
MVVAWHTYLLLLPEHVDRCSWIEAEIPQVAEKK